MAIGDGTLGLNQTATYWSRNADDGYGGYSYNSPVTHACRWQNQIKEIADQNGEMMVSEAVVWVTVELEEGGYLYLGESIVADPTQLHDAHVIRKVMSTPSIRGEATEYRVYL